MMQQERMRILVTGGAGMVGSHAAQRWASHGHAVTVLDNLMRSALFGSARESVEHTWRLLEQQPGIRRIRADIRDAAAVGEALRGGVDIVLHAAGQPGVGYAIAHPEDDFAINAQGTRTVLEAVLRESPKATVLFCSTNKVYGEGINAIPLIEEEKRYAFGGGLKGISESWSLDLEANTPYGFSKGTADAAMREYAERRGLRTGVFRMSCIYGVRQFGFEDQGWLAHLAICMMLDRGITLYGDGKQVRDVLFVDDLIQAFERFIASSLPHGVFNIGGGPDRTLSLIEYIEMLERLTGKRSPIRHEPWRPADQRIYVSDISLANRLLGWAPQVSIEDGVRRLLHWVQTHRDLLEDAAPQDAAAAGERELSWPAGLSA